MAKEDVKCAEFTSSDALCEYINKLPNKVDDVLAIINYPSTSGKTTLFFKVSKV